MKNTKAMFKVFKEGTTSKPITILKADDEHFDEKFKRDKYTLLGYTITEV